MLGFVEAQIDKFKKMLSCRNFISCFLKMARTHDFVCIKAFSLFLVFGTVQSCNKPGLQICWDNFMNDNGTDYSGLDAAGRSDRTCRNYQTYKNCFDPLATDCNADDTASNIFFCTNGVFEYLCNAGRADYIKYSDCWFNSSVSTEVNACYSKYYPTSASDPQAICEYLNKVIGCTNDIVNTRCGKDAVTVFSSYNAFRQRMAYQNITCQNVKNAYTPGSNNCYKTGSRTPNGNGYTPMTSSVDNPNQTGSRSPNGNGYTPVTSSVVVVLVAFLVAAYDNLNFV